MFWLISCQVIEIFKPTLNQLLIGMWVGCWNRKYFSLFWIFSEKGNDEMRTNPWITNCTSNQITIFSQHKSSKVAKECFKLNKPMHQATSHVRYSEKETASQKLQTSWEAEFSKHQVKTGYKFCHCMELKVDSEWWKLKGVPWINQCIRLQHMCAMQCIVSTTFTGSDVLGEWVSVPDLVILNSVQCKVTCIDSHWRRRNARRQKDGLT